jgi:predicted GNAT family N-acyltransferase
MTVMEPTVIFIGKSEQQKELYGYYLSQCQAIRKIVFIEGQNVDVNIDLDGKDLLCDHLLLLLDSKPIGTLRIRKTEEGTKLERVSILPGYRGKNYGKLLVQCAFTLAKPPIYIHAQAHSEGFYKSLGFTADNSPIFYEANIPHITMHWTQQDKGALHCNITRLS